MYSQGCNIYRLHKKHWSLPLKWSWTDCHTISTSVKSGSSGSVWCVNVYINPPKYDIVAFLGIRGRLNHTPDGVKLTKSLPDGEGHGDIVINLGPTVQLFRHTSFCMWRHLSRAFPKVLPYMAFPSFWWKKVAKIWARACKLCLTLFSRAWV